VIEIRAQEPADWQDVYELRVAAPDQIPYLRPDWVKEELANPRENTWPLVAVRPVGDTAQVVARANIGLWQGRRAHGANLTLEQHPTLSGAAGRRLLTEAIQVAEGWWNRRRLQAILPATDGPAVELFRSLGFVQETRLRQSVHIAGELVGELVLARLTGDAALPTREQSPPPPLPPPRPEQRVRGRVRVRGGSGDDWEALHLIWSQPSVYRGTMAIPYQSAEYDRRRVQQPPERFWPLAAEIDGQVVGNSGVFRDELNRSHVGHVGMMVHEAYQGMGVGTALMEAAIDLTDNWLGLSRLQLEVYTDNDRAIQLYQKYGFAEEGVWRSYAFRAGRYIDALVMGRLRDQGGHLNDR
jgi:L-phenylalanine/L-methionine N-acetyltransferase